MTSFKTTKEEDKLIAQGWKLELIPVQHDFPNCQVKYKTHCTNMKTCDLPPAPHLDIPKEFFKQMKPPKGFEDDIQRAKKVKFE